MGGIFLDIDELKKCFKNYQEKIEEHKKHLKNYQELAWKKLQENNNLNEYYKGYWRGRADSYQEALLKILGKDVDREHLKLD